MLPLLQTFVVLLLLNDFQCRRKTYFWMSSISGNFHLLKADLIFGNSLKSFEAKSGEWG
jgi:hypothetical protein